MAERSREEQYKRLRRLEDGSNVALTVRVARRFLRRWPNHWRALLLLGRTLTCLARYEEAEQALLKALDLCSAEQRRFPLYHLGHLFREAGDYDQAARWYREAVEGFPKDAGYRIFLGAVLAKQGRLIEAEEVHREATQCPEGCIDEAYLNLGLVLRARERFASAAECFREAIRLDPDYDEAKEALRDVERCLRLEGRR